MKKTRMIALMTTMILGGTTLLSSAAFAAEADTANSKAEVEFAAPSPGGDGPLTLTEAPALDFGSQEISAQDKAYTANAESKLSVLDIRGTAPGWHVNVSATPFMTTDSKELKGATIDFHKGTITSNDDDSTVSALDFTVTPGAAAVTALNATDGNGNAATTETFSAANVELKVPGSTAKTNAEYTSTLTWSLVDAPL